MPGFSSLTLPLLASEDCRYKGSFKREYFPVCDSTQQYAKAHENDLLPNEWRVVTTGQQRAGEGTHGRHWVSPPGNVYASFSSIFPKQKIEENITTLPQVAGVAVMQVLKAFSLNPQYKWVNDVLIDKHKVAGILCEGTTHSKNAFIVHIGIGVNVNFSKAACDAIGQPVTSLALALGAPIDEAIVLSLLERSIAHHFACLSEFGYSLFRTELEKRLAFRGEQIAFSLEDADKTVIHGTLEGLNEQGFLLLGDEAARVTPHHKGRILRL